MARELLSTPQEQLEDSAALEEQDLAYSTEESPPVVPPQDGDNAIANLEQARSTDIDDADIQDLQDPEGGYAAVMQTEAQPLIKSPEETPEADAEAYDNAKGLGLSFIQGLWNGTEEIGYTVAEMADSAIDMESPTYFKDWAKSVELQPTEWRNAGEAAMVASTANSLAGGAGQFLSGFMPALKALQVFKASGKVMPWMKKVIGTGVAGVALLDTGRGLFEATSDAVLAINRQDGTTSANIVQFYRGNNLAGTIKAASGAAPTFAANSDIRLKDNVVDHESELANVMALRPTRWDWKDEAKGTGEGFIAQELEQTAWSDLVSEGDDGFKQVSGLGAVETRLIKAIQEQQAMIETLQAEVAALKGA